jgi:hypothetical protein
MSFQIHALPAEHFAPLFGMSGQELAKVQATRMVVDAKPGYPCRVSLADAEVGETVILVNYQHQAADSPYRSAHAIFVREHAKRAFPERGEVPEVLTTRLISARAFDDKHYMVNADVVDGKDLHEVIPAMLRDAGVAYLHLHNAKPGCFAARVTRA